MDLLSVSAPAPPWVPSGCESLCVPVSISPSLWWAGQQRLCQARCSTLLEAGRQICSAHGTGKGAGCRAGILGQWNFPYALCFPIETGYILKKRICLFDRRFARDTHSDWGVRADWNPALGLGEAHQSQSWHHELVFSNETIFLRRCTGSWSPIALLLLLVTF